MMGLALLFSLVFHSQDRWNDRAAFIRAISQIKEGYTYEQVKAILGQPDDLVKVPDSMLIPSTVDTEWRFGTNGHGTLATLGTVGFFHGRVTEDYGSMAALLKGLPSPTVISEPKLRQVFRLMYQDGSSETDARWMIQTANLLEPLGKETALNVLLEYSRLAGGDGLFWLVRVLFQPKNPPGYIALAALGRPSVMPPADLRTFPTYPILLVDDVPFTIWQGAMIGGFPEPFTMYVRNHRDEWTLRQGKLRPPDDPFPAFKKVIALPEWNLLRDALRSSGKDQNWADGVGLGQVLSLVRTAYRLDDLKSVLWKVHGSDYEKYHQAFLALGCHWDEVKQRYVRKDGSSTSDAIKTYEASEYRFSGIPHLTVTLRWQREDDKSVAFWGVTDESGRKKLPVALLSVIDVESGDELFWMPLNADIITDSLMGFLREKTASQPPHEPKEGRRIASGWDSRSGRKIRFVVEFGGKKYTSPVFTP